MHFHRIALAVVFLATCTLAHADQAADLQARFKQRYPHLIELKTAGAVGETSVGMIDFVKGGADAPTQQFVSEENADRTALYTLLASKNGTSPDQVAKVNAQRNFAKAKAGDWLKGDDGAWKQKS